MKRNSSMAFPWLGSLTVSGILIFSHSQALAQVTPDNTLGDESSVVNIRDATSESIDGGAVRGQNLFHSFQEFNVGEDRGVYFSNPDDVTNIFSRVTGNDVSNILGTLGVDGAANLFLINPNGIVFGEGASLDVQGSFAATTADGIEFGEQGFFSAVNPESPPLLTINPSAYLFNQVEPEAIANNSRANNNIGLQVQPGKNISLIGGNVSFNGGKVVAPAGNVELGGLIAPGEIGIDNNGSLSFPEGVARGDVFLTQEAFVDVSGTEGGNITVNAGDLEISGNSELQTGTFADTGLDGGQSRDIILNATGAVEINASILDAGVGIGNAGDIEISATSFFLTNDGEINNSTVGQGNAGNITINATNNVSLDIGNIVSNVGSKAEGNAGEISISANSISLTNGAQIQSGVFEGGRGNGKNVTLNARRNVTISSSDRGTSGIFTDIEKDVAGNGGNIEINAQDSIFLNNASLNSKNAGTGYSGDINLDAPNEISIKDSQILAEGNFGRIFIGNSIEPFQVTLEGQRTTTEDGSEFQYSNQINTDSSNSEDLAGNITINARDNINVIGSDIQSETKTIRTTDINDQDGLNFSKIKLKVAEDNTIGTITINQSRINASNSGTGYAGNVILNARDNIQVLDTSIFGRGKLGQILIGKSNLSNETSSLQEITLNNSLLTVSNKSDNSVASPETQINGGEISIDAINNISFVNGSKIKTVTERRGNAGNLTISSKNGSIFFDNSYIFSNVNPGGIGDAGDINITAANSISLINGSELQSGIVDNIDNNKIIGVDKINDDFLDSNPSGRGNGGNITLNARESITLSDSNALDLQDGSGIFTDVESNAIGIAGNIKLTTGSLFLTDKAILTTRSLGLGYAGKITVNANSINLDNNSKIEALNTPSADISTTLSGGNINLQISDNLILRDNSDISTEASIDANGGNINITADSVIAFDDSDIFAFAADGQGGNINLNTPAFFAENFSLNSLTANPDFLDNNSRADINATGAVSGSVSIPDLSFIQNSLNNLPNNSINTDELVANSCVVPLGDRKKGKFFITGTESFPLRPGDALPSKYPTGEVRDVPEHSSWQPGDPIVEPQGAYRLANGKLVLSRECSR